MLEGALAGHRVLIVEDDYFVASESERELTAAGARVLGPVPSVEGALDLLGQETPDVAILGVPLHGEPVFPVADALAAGGVPFLFATGYHRAMRLLGSPAQPRCWGEGQGAFPASRADAGSALPRRLIRACPDGLVQRGSSHRTQPMPRFYFHLRGPEGLDRDDVGLELASVEAAYLGACQAVPGMSADLVYEAENPIRYGFEIAGESGTVLMEVPFAEVLDRGRKRAAPPAARRFREGRAEMERTAGLITALHEARARLDATLSETRRLLGLAKRTGRSKPGRRKG